MMNAQLKLITATLKPHVPTLMAHSLAPAILDSLAMALLAVIMTNALTTLTHATAMLHVPIHLALMSVIVMSDGKVTAKTAVISMNVQFQLCETL